MASKLSRRQKIGISLLVALAVILFVLIMLWIFSDDDDNDTSRSGSSSGGTSSSRSSSSRSSNRGSSSSNCTVPTSPATEGYDLSNVTGSLSKDSFSITGVDCASGYGGTPSATACSVAGQAYTLSGCSVAESAGSGTTNPCSLADVVPPTGGALGTRCADRSGYLAHGVSCDMTCNDGSTLTNQPLCNNGVLSSITATCSPVVPEPASEQMCVQPSSPEITAAYNFTGAQGTLTMGGGFRVTGITCNPGYGPGGNIVAGVCNSADPAYTLTGCSDINECDNNPCGTGATCTNNDGGYTCSCGPGYTGDTTDTPCVEMTCDNTDGLNTQANCGTGATCSDGVVGDGYTCSCDSVAGYTGDPVLNAQASCIQDVDCVGSFGGCVNCIKTYRITTPQSGNGNSCPHSAGYTERCTSTDSSSCDISSGSISSGGGEGEGGGGGDGSCVGDADWEACCALSLGLADGCQ